MITCSDTVARIQGLYDQNRFLDAYRETAPLWSPATRIDELSPSELVLAGRLATRLGGVRLSRALFRTAYAKAPYDPAVRYFARSAARRHPKLIDQLRDLEETPDLPTESNELRVSWLASNGVLWATCRDFERAHECIARARQFGGRDAWLLSCESEIFGMEDRWDDALCAAERSWEINPGTPYAAQCLGAALLNRQRVADAAQRLAAAAETGQSYEVAHLACWYLCATAETQSKQDRPGIVNRALKLAARLPELAPLADREVHSQIARRRLDMAELLDDHQEMEKWAAEVRLPYWRTVLGNLRKNPAGCRIRLAFSRPIQKHLACLPTSLSSALSAMEVAVDPDEMAREITYGGTTFWAAADWLRDKGLVCRFFAVTPELSARLIKSGIAFVLNLDFDDFAHAVAVVGLDEAAGTLLIHDPQSFRSHEYLLDSVDRDQKPLGPIGMVVVPAARQAEVDALLAGPDADCMAAQLRHQKAVALHGAAAGREIVADMLQSHPRHPLTRLQQAAQHVEDGHLGKAMAAYQALAGEFPHSPVIRSSLLSACHGMGNTARTRAIMAEVVERGALPGVASQQEWVHPPVTYVCNYADSLIGSAATRRQAHFLLQSVIRRQPSCGQAWHILGDLLWREQDVKGSLLAFRLAACLADNNEHYARSYADGLCQERREEEGLAWLEKRARRFADQRHASWPWTTWISALEEWGYPERALAVCREGLELHGQNAGYLAFAIPFFARMGCWEEAQDGLQRLQSAGNPALFHEAAMEYHRMRGSLDKAIQHAEDGVREAPRSIPAYRALLQLLAQHAGSEAAVERAASWSAEHPSHDDFEELYARQLERAHRDWKLDALLYRRVRRNPEDGWAWRELTFRRLNDFEMADSTHRGRLQSRIEKLLAECDRTAPEDPSTLRAHALWIENRGQWNQALAAWRAAIDCDPTSFYSYRRIWECATRGSDQERRSVFEQIEPLLLRCPGRLDIARDLIFLVARRFGAASADVAATRWREQRPDDPEVVEAAADLLLEHGQGRTDAQRALDLLEPAIRHFPYHADLRFSLARAFRQLGRVEEAESTFREIVRRHPDNVAAHLQLAWIHHRRGNNEEAFRLLNSTEAFDRMNPDIRDARVQMLIRSGDLAAAREAIDAALRQLPRSVFWRERAVHLLLECGDEEAAVAAARAGVCEHPRGAYLWYLLGTTLNRVRRLASQGEIEKCLRTSLQHNATLFQAADELVMLLTAQRQYDVAEEVIADIADRQPDPSPAQGRLAWIRRERGEKSVARDQLAAVVRAFPWYEWGWRVLMEWLVEDEVWEQARSVLRDIPPPLRATPHFRYERLKVLAKAGVPRAELDGEWDQLLRDFPENLGLYQERFDALRQADMPTEAAAVLRSILPVAHDDPYTLARLVWVLSEEGKPTEAQDTLLRIWFSEMEESPWPAKHAWEGAENSHWNGEAYRAARRKIEAGERPTRTAFSIIVNHALINERLDRYSPQSLWRNWFGTAGVRDVLQLLHKVDQAPWANGAYRAEVLRQLSDTGHYRSVVRYWKKHRTLVESDTVVWSEVGRALASTDHKAQTRKLLSSWRDHPGAGMWVLTNYLLCTPRYTEKQLREVLATCRDGLAGLPHDHCAQYLAHVLAEVYATLGDVAGFRQTWEHYRNYFTGSVDGSDYFESRRRYLLDDIPHMAELLQQGKMTRFRLACWKMRIRQILIGSPSLRGSGSHGNSHPNLWWAALVVGMLLIQMFRLWLEK